MTTVSWSTKVRHDSDAEFRLWGAELNAKLAAVGMVQTADTGQIDWVTVVRAGVSADAGYEIWRTSDALHATAPIYIKIYYGTHTSTTSPRIRIQTGISSNGTGTLVGVLSSATNAIQANTTQTTNTARQSFLCYTDFGLCLSWKQGAGVTEGMFAFCRTVDSSGAATAAGAVMVWGLGATTLTATQAFKYSSPTQVFADQNIVAQMALGFNPQGRGSTSDGTNNEVAVGYGATPHVTPFLMLCGVIPSEATPGTTFTAAPVGATTHTYMSLTANAGSFGPIINTTSGGMLIATMWE